MPISLPKLMFKGKIFYIGNLYLDANELPLKSLQASEPLDLQVVPVLRNPNRFALVYLFDRRYFAPYYLGRMCRRDHNHLYGYVLRYGCNGQCAECRTGKKPRKFVNYYFKECDGS